MTLNGRPAWGTMKTMIPADPEPEPYASTWRLMTTARLLFAGALMAVFAFLAMPVHAQSDLWRMEAFTSEIEIRSDGSLLVEETIEAEFLQPRHGIFRYLPVQGTTVEGETYRLDVTLLRVTDDAGNPHQVKRSKSGNNLVWRIGDPGVTLTGDMTYVLTYEVHDALLRLEDRDELFWNVAGFGWDVPLPIQRATVSYPAVDPASVQARCYTGHAGSTAENCAKVVADVAAGFISERPGEQLTVAVGLPKGLVGEEVGLVAFARFLRDWWHLSIPFLFLAFYWAAWREHGDDDTGLAIVPEYEPPEGLRPAQVKALMHQGVSSRELAPTIVDLAVRGYLTIEEIDKPWYKGGDDYLLKRTEKKDGLATYEDILLTDIFGLMKEKKVSELKDKFYKDVPAFTSNVMASVVEKYFDAHPLNVRIKWIVPGLVALVLIFIVATRIPLGGLLVPAGGTVAFVVYVLMRRKKADGKDAKAVRKSAASYAVSATIVFIVLFVRFFPSEGAVLPESSGMFVSLVLAAVIVLGFGWAMPRWTTAGAAAHRHAQGFKLFISKVKKYRTEWEEKENIFETVLPYALAFGLGKKWAAAFEGLLTSPPSWYVGANAGAWNPIAFQSSVSAMTKSFSSAATSSPSSRGGSGGGGFSGGGFGGGGGGSW